MSSNFELKSDHWMHHIQMLPLCFEWQILFATANSNNNNVNSLVYFTSSKRQCERSVACACDHYNCGILILLFPMHGRYCHKWTQIRFYLAQAAICLHSSALFVAKVRIEVNISNTNQNWVVLWATVFYFFYYYSFIDIRLLKTGRAPIFTLQSCYYWWAILVMKSFDTI